MINPNEEKVLVNLGLTPSQARVYLVLAHKGASKVTFIAQFSGIHRTHLYEILRSLEERGFVHKQLSTGTYVATPIKNTAQTLVDSKRQEVQTLESQLNDIVNSLTEENEEILLGKKELLLSTSKAHSFSRGQKIIDAAKLQVDHMHTWKRFTQLWNLVGNHMTATMDRGIKVRQVTEVPADISQAKRFLNRVEFRHPNFELRFVHKTGGNVTIVDNERVFLSTSQDKEDIGDTPLLFSNYEGLLGLMRNYYDYCWLYGYKLEDGKLVGLGF